MMTKTIEESLNIITYLREYNEYYRGTNFIIAQTENLNWIVITNTSILPAQLGNYREALAYATGYIDGCIDERHED